MSYGNFAPRHSNKEVKLIIPKKKAKQHKWILIFVQPQFPRHQSESHNTRKKRNHSIPNEIAPSMLSIATHHRSKKSEKRVVFSPTRHFIFFDFFSFDLDNLFVALGGNWRFSFLVEQHGRHRDDKRNQVRRRHSGIFIIVRASLRAISDFAVNVATQRTLEQSAAVRVNFN